MKARELTNEEFVAGKAIAGQTIEHLFESIPNEGDSIGWVAILILQILIEDVEKSLSSEFTDEDKWMTIRLKNHIRESILNER